MMCVVFQRNVVAIPYCQQSMVDESAVYPICCSLPEISAFCRPKELGTQSERKGARFCGGDWQEY